MVEGDAERQLVQDALAGDRTATRVLVARLRPAVQAEAAHLLRSAPARRSPHDLRDLVNDVFVALWSSDGALLRRWDPARGRSFDSYVRLVARSRALDILRSRRRSPWREEPVDPGDVAEAVSSTTPSADRQAGARDALRKLQVRLREQLSARDWLLFTSLFTEERTVAQVSEEVGMTPAAVYQWRSRFVRNVLPRLADGLELGSVA